MDKIKQNSNEYKIMKKNVNSWQFLSGIYGAQRLSSSNSSGISGEMDGWVSDCRIITAKFTEETLTVEKLGSEPARMDTNILRKK